MVASSLVASLLGGEVTGYPTHKLYYDSIQSKLHNNIMKHDCVVFLGFELVGRITKILYVDEISCGLRCLQDKKCQSYNSKSDVSDAKK